MSRWRPGYQKPKWGPAVWTRVFRASPKGAFKKNRLRHIKLRHTLLLSYQEQTNWCDELPDTPLQLPCCGYFSIEGQSMPSVLVVYDFPEVGFDLSEYDLGPDDTPARTRPRLTHSQLVERHRDASKRTEERRREAIERARHRRDQEQKARLKKERLRRIIERCLEQHIADEKREYAGPCPEMSMQLSWRISQLRRFYVCSNELIHVFVNMRNGRMRCRQCNQEFIARPEISRARPEFTILITSPEFEQLVWRFAALHEACRDLLIRSFRTEGDTHA